MLFRSAVTIAEVVGKASTKDIQILVGVLVDLTIDAVRDSLLTFEAAAAATKERALTAHPSQPWYYFLPEEHRKVLAMLGGMGLAIRLPSARHLRPGLAPQAFRQRSTRATGAPLPPAECGG